MFNYMGCDQQMVEDGVKKFGLAVGARKMIDSQYQHAIQSIQSGIYITYYNQTKKQQCTRLGSNSKCFCGHLFKSHNNIYFGKKQNLQCKDCDCKIFKFVPSRPQQCGMYWLVRRKDFDLKSWRPPCKCKHNCEQHQYNYPLKCKKCNCYNFQSNFACLTCDGLWQHHQMLFQTYQQRKMLKKKVGEQYIPLSTHKNIQNQVFKQQKFTMIKGKSLPPSQQQKKKQLQIHKKLNPAKPSKQQQQKIQSPFGFIIKPKYPQFLSKK